MPWTELGRASHSDRHCRRCARAARRPRRCRVCRSTGQGSRGRRGNPRSQLTSPVANEDALLETRRLVATFETKEELSAAFRTFIASNADEAYVLYRELDYFEQLAALEHVGAFDFELIKLLLG